MSRLCEITGISVLSGNNVSHSQRKTRRKFLPNLQKMTFSSQLLNSNIQLRVTTKGLRTVEKYGGIDGFFSNKERIKKWPLSKKASKVASLISDKSSKDSTNKKK